MIYRGHLPLPVREPARAVVAEALQIMKVKASDLLVEVWKGAHKGHDFTTGHADWRACVVVHYQGLYPRSSKTWERQGKPRPKKTIIDCEGKITLTPNWPPCDPETWARKFFESAIHEAAHIAGHHTYTREEEKLPHAERVVEQEAYAAVHEAMTRITPRRKALLEALAQAAEAEGEQTILRMAKKARERKAKAQANKQAALQALTLHQKGAPK